MLRDSVEIAAYGFAALVAVPCVLCLLARLFRCVGRSPLWRQCRAVILALLAAATIATIKAQKRTGTTGVPPVAGGTTGTTGVSPVANPITNTLYISAIAVSSNDTVTLTAAWPENFLTADQTLDVLGKENLHNETWTWLTNGVITTSATNISWTLENQSPSNHFYKVVVRESLTDMDDPDGDGLPNVYELARGRNPWVHDYALVQKLIVGTNDTYTTISTALAASTPYSVIEIAPGMYSGMGWSGVTLPEHPVLITGTGKRPVIRGDSFATFLLPSNSTEQTLLRNLSIDLGGRGGLRAGFWCGGNLPWSGQTASATFDNIYVRMPDSDAQYYGWIFYRSSTNRAVLSRCAVNAAGARDAVGVFAIDPPPISVENCTFANFPSNAPGYRGAALLLKTTVQNFGCVSNEVEVSVTGSVFDDSFTDALPLARFEEGTNFLVRMQDCALLHALEAPYLPDYSSSLWVTNGQTAWSGHALVDSLVADLGLGALPILENDPSTDSDGDGLSDYEEVYERGTDPFLVDSDNDGVTDGKEKDDGTDPTNPYSFTQRLLVTVTNTASTAYAVYTAWGGLERVWEANEQVMFPQGFGDTPYTNASPHGATHVKAFCDLNGNGEYDANADILLMRQIPTGSTAQINITFGDVDGDGVSDAQERSEGTDPYDGENFRLVATVNVESADVVPGMTNYVAWGYVPAGWEGNGLDSFAGRSLPFLVDTPVTNGELFVKVFRDFNANGVYDAGVDAFVSNKLTRANYGKVVTFKIGDSDGDSIVDSVERDEMTDPLGIHSYCFWMSAEVTGIFHTTNSLTLTATFGGTTLCSPTIVTTNVWGMDFGHLLATNGEKVVLTIWDDANSNLVCDAEEVCYRRDLGPTGHVNAISFNMPYGNFDRDNNSLLDWWEAVNGLSTVTNGGPYADTDGDGLINLHEYWADCNPLVPDGSNTLLSVMARAVDSRLFGCDPVTAKHVYSNYGMLITNPVCWVSGVDISCASHKNSTGYNMRSATAISPRHVIMATHASAPIGTVFSFLGNDGVVYGRTLVAANSIQGSDINIGLLDECLPSAVSYARILPSNYSDYIRTAKALPTLVFDYERKALVMDLQDLPVTKGALASCRYSTNPLRALFGEEVISGDSGNPRFLIMGDQVVLLNTLWKGGAGSGAFLTLWRNEIQEAMDALAIGYQLEFADFSSFDTLGSPNGEAK